MLILKEIRKSYTVGGVETEALKGVSLAFRKSEFVAVLGPSGCGKTTTLNIIGGLDRYTSGDLIINGRSTKEYSDRDWDRYRNHSVGFVFQSYNLIPHQSVLANVELALTLSGVSKSERRRRAMDALAQVGLADQAKKNPNQLSGGQMQRVAIARALINDPEILLADEPTGALDSETSVQVMELLKEVAKDRLVIMVTHNPDLAEAYATRIVRLKDGLVVGDTDPYAEEEARKENVPAVQEGKTSMSFLTALSLSLNNLRTKMGRTVLTAFAGSIGIIGIALILALSTGINSYINQIQEETLSSYPITIQAESTDMTAMLSSLMGAARGDSDTVQEADRVYASTVMFDMLNSMINAEVQTNNLEAFKEYLDNGGGGIADLATIQYSYDFDFDIYTEDAEGNIVKCDVVALMESAMSTLYGGDYSSYFESMGGMYAGMDVWQELLPGENGEAVSSQTQGQYELLYGAWPQNYDEVILFVDANNQISDLMLYALGLMSQSEMDESLTKAMNGETVESEALSWSYEELCDRTFKLILPASYYQYDSASGSYHDLSGTEAGMDYLFNSEDVGVTLKVVGIARAEEGATSAFSTGGIGYTNALTTHAIEETEKMDIVVQQLANPDTDVFTGLPFATGEEAEPTAEEKISAITAYLSALTVEEKAQAYRDAMAQPSNAYVEEIVSQQTAEMTRESIEEMIVERYAQEMGVDGDTVRGYIADMDDETLFAQVEEAIATQVREQYAAGVEAQLAAMTSEQLSAALDAALAGAGDMALTEEQYIYLYDTYMPATVSEATYEENLDRLSYVELGSPSSISIYATSFAEKDEIADLITAYNESVDNEEDEITYTDYVALLMSSITDIINGISYLLIAFVSISLIVSSIMIGIITNISVLERTKEIGILRAVGASKRDVSRVFNAETFIVGLAAGLIGIAVSVLATIPINAILHHFTGIQELTAVLPVAGGAILVVISMLLTVVAGLIPARSAAKKDPVEALRTE